MLPLLLALALAPWAHLLGFHALPGWQTGASGTTHSRYGGHAGSESAAWIARNVRYRDPPTADPPNKTLAHLPRNAVIVWAVTYSPVQDRQRPILLDFAKARRFDCCEATYVADGEYELSGSGPGHAYSMIVRIYFGSHPTSRLRALAQLALRQLQLAR